MRLFALHNLLKYLIAYRQVSEFHEHCVERIFVDIYKAIAPEVLHVEGRFCRRGGIDVLPYRSTANGYRLDTGIRLVRQ